MSRAGLRTAALRKRLRRARLSLAAAIAGRRSILIPYRDAPDLKCGGYPSIEERFAAAAPAFEASLASAERHIERLSSFKGPPPEPRWNQDWFPRLDGAIAYAFVAELRPARIIEIGSGHSTRFMARAIKDAGSNSELICIDPAPRAFIEGLPIIHLPHLVQDAPRQLFENLRPGDVLFVDSSHVAHAGSDVELLLAEIVPALATGALVHIHDTFLPDPYPGPWRKRHYNEQAMTAALVNAGLLEPLFASHYVATRMASRLDASPLARLPLPAGAFEASFWARVTRPSGS
jgi:hypothetical protein